MGMCVLCVNFDILRCFNLSPFHDEKCEVCFLLHAFVAYKVFIIICFLIDFYLVTHA